VFIPTTDLVFYAMGSGEYDEMACNHHCRQQLMLQRFMPSVAHHSTAFAPEKWAAATSLSQLILRVIVLPAAILCFCWHVDNMPWQQLQHHMVASKRCLQLSIC
jgi:hypothetical protein